MDASEDTLNISSIFSLDLPVAAGLVLLLASASTGDASFTSLTFDEVTLLCSSPSFFHIKKYVS